MKEKNIYLRGSLWCDSDGSAYGCGMVVQCRTLRWFLHLERMGENEMTTEDIELKKVDAVGVKGRSLQMGELCQNIRVGGWQGLKVRGIECTRK